MTPPDGGVGPLIENVVRQLRALGASVGTGVLPAGGPADALANSARAIEAGHDAHRTAIGHLGPAWRGRAGEAAFNQAAAVQDSASRMSERGIAAGRVLGAASADVNAASARLDELARDFASAAAGAGPELATPSGIAMITQKAQENLGRAIAIVNDTRTRLADHTARIQGLLPPPGEVPDPVRSGAVWPLPGRVPPQVQGLLAAGSGLAGDAERLIQSGIGDAERALRGGPPLPPTGSGGLRIPDEHTFLGPGVQLRLPNGSTVTAPNERAATAVRAALGQRGVPYVWGGESPGHGMDCSGLTRYAYGKAGIALPHSAIDQRMGTNVDRAHVQPGDLAVWSGHVAMVVGNGQMIEAGNPVEISSIRTENEGMDFYGFFRPTA